MSRTPSGTGPKPLRVQRSEWRESTPVVRVTPTARSFCRLVHDGALWAIVDLEPTGWHLSISFRDRRDRPVRYPTWDEIAHARYELLPDDITVAMLLPPTDEYVAVHASVFHLHELAAEASA